MKKSKATKRTLLLSVLAMLLCMVMLVGTTFAWFTDSASTAVNKIQAGTLDIALEMKDADDNWVTAEGKTLSFKKAAGHEGEEILWEPGCTYDLQSFKIKNAGNLALKYKIQITGIQGDAELNNVIDWTYTLADGNAFPITEEGKLAANAETGLITISGKMQKSAGNEYQGKYIDNIAITVVATQDTVEYDSYNNTYDADAQYPYPVSTDAELAEAITTVGSGSVIALTSGTFSLPETGINKGVTIAGNGADNTTVQVPATPSGANKTGLVVDKENVTISNVTISGNTEITSDEYYGVIDIREGGTTLDNVSISRSYSNASCVVIKRGVDSGETVTLKNSTLKGGFKTIDIVDGANGTVIIDNCDITGIYTFNVNSASSQDLTVKVTDSKLHGWTSYGRIKEAVFENTEFSKGSSNYDYLRPYADTTLTDCTFDSGFLMGAGTTGFTITLNNCVKNGVAVTAENVQSLLLDADDMSNLSGCTIIVNGVTVTLS